MFRGDRDGWSESLTQLCECPLADPPLFRDLMSDMRRFGWADDARTILEESIRKGFAGPAAREAWLTDTVAEQQWEGCARTIDKEFGASDAWSTLVEVYLLELGRADGQRIAILQRYLDENRDRLSENNGTWCAAGYALTASGLYRQAIAWLARWQERPGLMSSALTSLVYCYAARGELKKCAETARQALKLMPDDGDAVHHLWLAALMAIDKNYASAAGHFREIDASVIRNSATYVVLYQLMSCVIQFHERATLSGRDCYSQVSDQFRQIRAAQLPDR